MHSPSWRKSYALMRMLNAEDGGTALIRNFDDGLAVDTTGIFSYTGVRTSYLTSLFIVCFLTCHEFRLIFAIFSLYKGKGKGSRFNRLLMPLGWVEVIALPYLRPRH